MAYFSTLLENWRLVLQGGIIVVSAVIVIMGMMKKLFDKIPNKLLRKFLLALTSVVVVLPVTAIYFVSRGIDYKYFWIDYALLSIATIVTYWLYENTCLRDLIHLLGSLTIGRLIKHFVGCTATDGGEDIEELQSTVKSLEGAVETAFSGESMPIKNKSEEEPKIRIPIANTASVVVRPNRSAQKEAEELKNL